jgi:hypothetical protein
MSEDDAVYHPIHVHEIPEDTPSPAHEDLPTSEGWTPADATAWLTGNMAYPMPSFGNDPDTMMTAAIFAERMNTELAQQAYWYLRAVNEELVE